MQEDENLNLTVFIEVISIIERIKSTILKGEKKPLSEKAVFDSKLYKTEKDEYTKLITSQGNYDKKEIKKMPLRLYFIVNIL